MIRPVGDRWHEVDRLFQRALELPGAERLVYVARSCRDDPELRAAVEELLEVTEEADPFLEGSVEDVCELPWPEIFRDRTEELWGDGDGTPGAGGSTDRTAERVGPYRLVRRIGRGGMASVYLAERADGQFDQRVAVKLLRRGLDTEDVVRRFMAERQILSSLTHSNIARLLDGGATDDGLPFLVMEYVKGTPIVAYCDERRLPVPERLSLFCDAGRAVQFAHRSLVVHRDLKPSNILVDAEDRVKLLDFGIAKLLAPSADVEATRTGLRALTPAYASPEQVRGDPITTASDVYQLGILLCQLLAGRPPYEVRALSPARAEREITESQPARPSSLVTEEAAAARSATREELSGQLRGDLDSIVLQAVRKEPEARYASADALVDDLERHLAGQPVRARPPTVGYRARKFVGRHRASVAAAATFAVLLAGSAIVASLQARRLAVERDRALAQEARAEQVTGFLADMFQGADPNETGGTNISALELLDAGASRAMSEFEGHPRTQADVLSTIGSMYIQRGLYERAEPFLERAVELDRIAGDDPADLVRDLRGLAAAVYPDRMRAISILEEAVAVAERELGPNDPRLAGALTDLAENLGKLPGPDARQRSEEAVERALAILRAQDGDVRAELASALHLSALGQGLKGLPRIQEALELRRSLYGENHTAVAATLNDMGLILESSDPEAADSLLERAVEINARIHGAEHAQTLAIMNNLAGRYRDRGEYAGAEPLYRELLRRRREVYPTDSVGQAYVMHGLGWSLTELGRPEEAEPLLRESFRLLAKAGHDRTSILHHVARSTLGRSLAAQGRYAEAEPLLRESYEWAATHDPHPNFIPFMLERLIDLYDAWERSELASEYRARRLEWEGRQTADESAAGDSASKGELSSKDR